MGLDEAVQLTDGGNSVDSHFPLLLGQPWQCLETARLSL
jgi:hypothetical protein